MSEIIKQKSRTTALFLFFFLYCFGVHFFYLKQTKKAFTQIGLFLLAIIFYIIWGLQTNFGTQGGSIFFSLSWILCAGGWIWGLVNTIKLTKK